MLSLHITQVPIFAIDYKRFILEVQTHDIIYDTKLVFYKDYVRKERACDLIA